MTRREKYRATVEYRKLRPFQNPDSEDGQVKQGARYGCGEDYERRVRESFRQDQRTVGNVETLILDNNGEGYDTLRGATQSVAYHTTHYPFNHDWPGSGPSIEILVKKFEKAEPVWTWNEVNV